MNDDKQDVAALERVAEMMVKDRPRFLEAMRHVRCPQSGKAPKPPTLGELDAYVRGSEIARDQYQKRIETLEELHGAILAKKKKLGQDLESFESEGERRKRPIQEALDESDVLSREATKAERKAIRLIDEDAAMRKKVHQDEILSIAIKSSNSTEENRKKLKVLEQKQDMDVRNAAAEIKMLESEDAKKKDLLRETRAALVLKQKEIEERKNNRHFENLKTQFWDMGFRIPETEPDRGQVEDEHDIQNDRGSFLNKKDMRGFAHRMRNGVLSASAPPRAGKRLPPGYVHVTYDDDSLSSEGDGCDDEPMEEDVPPRGKSPWPTTPVLPVVPTPEQISQGGKKPQKTSPPPPVEDPFGAEITRLVNASVPGGDVMSNTGQLKRSVKDPPPEAPPPRKKAKCSEKPRAPRPSTIWPEDPNAMEYRSGLDGPHCMPYESGMVGEPVVCKWCGKSLETSKDCPCRCFLGHTRCECMSDRHANGFFTNYAIAQAYCKVDGTGLIDKTNTNLSEWRKLVRDTVSRGQPGIQTEKGHGQIVLESLFRRSKVKKRITHCGMCNVELMRTKSKNNRGHAMCNSCRVYPGFTEIGLWMRAKVGTGTVIQRSEWVRWVIEKMEKMDGDSEESVPWNQMRKARFDLYPKRDYEALNKRLAGIHPSQVWRIWSWARIGEAKLRGLGLSEDTVKKALDERRRHKPPKE